MQFWLLLFETFATLMWHLWRFSLLNVTVKVLVDRCLETDVGRAGLMYEWVQFGGSLKAVVVTTGRLHTSCYMATNSAKYPVAFILSVCLDALCPHVPRSLSVLHRGNNKTHTTIVNQRTYLQTCDCILHQEGWGQMTVAPEDPLRVPARWAGKKTGSQVRPPEKDNGGFSSSTLHSSERQPNYIRALPMPLC